MAYSDDDARTWFNVNQGAGDNDIRKAMEQYGIGFDQIARVTGVSRDEVKTRYNAARNSDPTLKQSYIAPSVSAVPPVGDLVQDRVRSWFESNPLASDFEIAQAMKKYGVGPGLVSSVTGLPLDQVNNRYAAALANPSAGLNEAPETGINLSRLQDTTKWDVAPDQTVFAQLQKVLASDSPLMQMARTRAMQDASSRGLLNSSMAGTAGEAALYDAAMPIATADAGTYAGAAQFNAGASNDFARDNNAFTREAFMAEYNLAANEWAKRQDQQRTLDAMSIDQQYMLDRDAIQNGYQSARDAIANGWQIERDATTQQYTLQRDSQQNQYTLERDAIQNGYQQASTSQDQANVDADRRFNALSNLTSLKTDFQTQLMNIGTNYEGDAETEKAQNLWNSYKPLIEQWAVLAGLDPTTQTAGIAPVAKEAA